VSRMAGEVMNGWGGNGGHCDGEATIVWTATSGKAGCFDGEETEHS
jgi:hypothetical protein